MPGKRKYTGKKKAYERKRGASARKRRRTVWPPGTVVSLGQSPFPASMVTKHRYCETVALDAAIAVPAYYVFSCNGLYDPNITSTGHQPLGFDEMSALYDHYTVLGSKITVNAQSVIADVSSGGCMVGCYVNDDTSPVFSYNTVMEQGGAVSKLLSPLGSGGGTKFSKGCSIKKWMGVNDPLNHSELTGNSAANPAEGIYFILFCQGLDSTSNPSGVYFDVCIEYTAIWRERKSLGQS